MFGKQMDEYAKQAYAAQMADYQQEPAG